jgi:hypothetical protein
MASARISLGIGPDDRDPEQKKHQESIDPDDDDEPPPTPPTPPPPEPQSKRLAGDGRRSRRSIARARTGKPR